MGMGELTREEGVAVGLWGDTLVVYYDRTPTMATVAAIEAATKVEAQGVKSLTVLVAIEASRCRAPPADVRAQTQQTLQRFAERTGAIAYVLVGSGFGAAAARAVIGGILLVVRPNYPVKVFSTVREALPWLHSHSATKSAGAAVHPWADPIERFCARVRHPPRPDAIQGSP